MSITTKVKKTGQLFRATTDLGKDTSIFRDANGEIEAEAIYEGHLLEAYAYTRPTPVIEYSRAKWGIFRGYELETFPAELRFIHGN